jgi:hypothetical protein
MRTGMNSSTTNSSIQKEGKENNKNLRNAFPKEYHGKKFTGANAGLVGKIFDVTSRDAIHQFADTLKARADYVG